MRSTRKCHTILDWRTKQSKRKSSQQRIRLFITILKAIKFSAFALAISQNWVLLILFITPSRNLWEFKRIPHCQFSSERVPIFTDKSCLSRIHFNATVNDLINGSLCKSVWGVSMGSNMGIQAEHSRLKLIFRCQSTEY